MSYRDGPFNDLKVPLTWTAAVTVVVAIVAGLVMLATDRRETLQSEAYGVSRRMFDVADKPVAGVLSMPVVWVREIGEGISGYFFAVSENRRLKREIVDLRQWRDKAIALQNTNARYEAILGLKTDPPVPMVTGRSVLDSRGPFANTRLISVGADKGVKVGNPVMNERGLVGRIVGTSNGVSRVLLLTDVASRTPVLVDRTDARAILTGDGGGAPRMAYLRGINPVKEGDRILTSGDGGVFPRGLPVGVAAKGLDGQWRVRLYADTAAIDFVRVLQFEDFTSGVDEKALEKSQMPPVPASLLAADAAAAAATKLVLPPARNPDGTLKTPASGAPATAVAGAPGKPGAAATSAPAPASAATAAAAATAPATTTAAKEPAGKHKADKHGRHGRHDKDEAAAAGPHESFTDKLKAKLKEMTGGAAADASKPGKGAPPAKAPAKAAKEPAKP